MKKTIIITLLIASAIINVQAQKFIGQSPYLSIENKDAFTKAFAGLSATIPGLGKLVSVDMDKEMQSQLKGADLRMAVVVFDLKNKFEGKFNNAWPAEESVGESGMWFIGATVGGGGLFIGTTVGGGLFLPLAAGLSEAIKRPGQNVTFPGYMNLAKAVPGYKPKLSTVVLFDTGGKPISSQHLQEYAPKDDSRYALLLTLVDKQMVGATVGGGGFFDQHRPSMLVFF